MASAERLLLHDKIGSSACPHTLEQRLQTAKCPEEREKAFVELVQFHGACLVQEARRNAFILGLDAVSEGDAAVSGAFIRLAKSLAEPWPRERSFLDRFRGEIWNELRHGRAKAALLRGRFPPLVDEDLHEAPDADPERQYRSIERLNLVWRSMSRLSRTDQQLRLANAWRLNKLGYDWGEVRREVRWPGSCDSLRVSVSRFFSQLKGRIEKHAG